MVCFDKEAPPPIKNGAGGKRERAEFPFTAIYLKLLDLGFTADEAKSMSLSQALWYLRAANPVKAKPEGKATRQASQTDIDHFLR